MKRNFATLFGIGLVPWAPGTAGSLAAAWLGWAILQLAFGWAWLAVATALVIIFGTYAATKHMRAHGTDHDPGEIVVDELAGQWLTFTTWHLWLVAMAGYREAMPLLNEIASSPHFLAAGFVLFRLFDILKPWPISWADRKIGGGLGVMLDDILAGICAGTFLYALYLFWPYFTGTMYDVTV